MTQKPESRTVTALLRILNSLPWTVADKTHGDAFARRGRTDIVGCVLGFAFAIECKVAGNSSTPSQLHEQARWAAAESIVLTDVTTVTSGMLALSRALDEKAAYLGHIEMTEKVRLWTDCQLEKYSGLAYTTGKRRHTDDSGGAAGGNVRQVVPPRDERAPVVHDDQQNGEDARLS